MSIKTTDIVFQIGGNVYANLVINEDVVVVEEMKFAFKVEYTTCAENRDLYESTN